MPAINIDLGYFEHIKTKRLVGLLGKGAEALPIRLWCYCGMHLAESGTLAGYSAQEIETLVGWWGKPGKFVAAMVQVRFLEALGNGAGYQVHDWQEHAGHLAAFKKRAKTAAQARWGRYGDPMLQASLLHPTSNAPALPTEPAERTGSGEPVTDRCGNVETVETGPGPETIAETDPARNLSSEKSMETAVATLAESKRMDRKQSCDAAPPQKSEEQQALESAIYREALFRIHDNGILGNLHFREIAREIVNEAAGDLFSKRGYRELRGARLELMRETAWELLRTEVERISKMKPKARRGYLIARAIEVAALAGQIESQKPGGGKHGT